MSEVLSMFGLGASVEAIAVDAEVRRKELRQEATQRRLEEDRSLAAGMEAEHKSGGDPDAAWGPVGMGPRPLSSATPSPSPPPRKRRRRTRSSRGAE